MANNEQNRPQSRSNRDDDAPGWGVPLAFGAIVLLAGGIIFWSAGPDRTRTAESRLQPSAVTRNAPAPEASAPAPEQATPQRTDPSGRQ